MKIAMLTNNYKPFIGGVPISIERLSNSLRTLGHEVYIFAPTYKDEVVEDEVIRYRSFNKTTEDGAVIPNIWNIDIEKKFKKLGIDIIHVHHPYFIGWTALYLGKKYNIPVAYTYHTRYEQYLHHIKCLYKLEEISNKEHRGIRKYIAENTLNFIKNQVVSKGVKRYANKCDLVFAPTSLMKELLEKDGVTTPIQILPTGLNNQFFEEEVTSINKIRGQYIGDKKYLFCTVSRLTKEKNIESLIYGLKQLRYKIGDTFRVLIIGDGPLKNQLKELVKELELVNNVVFLSSISNEQLKNYYGACDLFLFTSKSETQGIVLLEAMANKTPVVAIKASGVIEVVKNGVNGYMTNDHIDEWASKISEMIEEGMIERLSQGAYQTSKQYSTEKVARLAEGYYKKMIYEYNHRRITCRYEETYEC